MCLDIKQIHNNQVNMEKVETNSRVIGKLESVSDFPIKCLCGGSLVDFQVVFDPNREVIYVCNSDKIRIFSVETGECVGDLDDNKDGPIVGLSINPENKKALIACTEAGTVFTWKLDSSFQGKLKITLPSLLTVVKFITTIVDGETHGIVLFKDMKNHVQLVLVELKKGKTIQHYEIPFVNDKNEVKVKLIDGSNNSNFFIAVQKCSMFVIDKKSSKFVQHKSTFAINVVACHPEEEIIATGEIQGVIKLWRNIFDVHPVKVELHWHHMIVLSLAFSQSGSILYSGGAECVLVKWQIMEKTIEKEFLPRLSGSIKQISVDPEQDRLAVSTDDNMIQMVNSNLTMLKSIQDFTQASKYDLGSFPPFPLGIVLNPRNHHLVMNGRIGHLQFFSTKTMKILFNMDVTMRNVVPRTLKANVFNVQVIHVAFSMLWMATVESWSDKINSSDLRLKFWRFSEGEQTYVLHTQIEQAHEKEIFSLEFSHSNDSDALICATAGRDRCVKIWSLEKSEEVKNPKLIWLCIEQLSYKNLPVKKIGFSQDSSLLAAGFGNVLCVWDAVNFNLKCALSAPACNDGSTNRVLFVLPGKSIKAVENLVEKRRKIADLMKSVVDGACGELLVKNITNEKRERFFKKKEVKSESAKSLKRGEKELIFNRVLALPDLSFNQKVQILHSLHIFYKINNRVENELIDFIRRAATETGHIYKTLHNKMNQVRNHEKYKIQWRFKTWNMLTSKRNRKFATVRKLLTHKINDKLLELKKAKENSETFLPVKNLMDVTNVVFCTEEFSHLVLVTTPDRMLIWNLLTLKIQGSFKIHTKLIILDPLTNLVAVFTKYKELFILHPSPALTIHHQRNVPEIYGAMWVPREVPRTQSVNVNWQATSQLLILTDRQQVCTFKIPGDDDYGDAVPFLEISNGFATTTPFAAIIAQKITDESMKDARGVTKRIAISESGATKDIINLSSHAMPPMRLLSKDFIGSMLSTQKQTKLQDEFCEDISETMEISDDDENSPQVGRKAIESESSAMWHTTKKRDFVNIENKMKNLRVEMLNQFEL